MNAIDRLFQIRQRGSTVGTELRGGVATFLTMAYILAVNPAILSSAGIPFESAVACTALAAGLCSILMGTIANFPIALASGMGLNAFIVHAATITGSWQSAMGLVVLDGLVVLALVAVGIREAMVDAIPVDLRRGISAGIGLFIALIGCVSAGLVTKSEIPGPPVSPGSFTQPTVLITLASICVVAVLLQRKTTGAILIGLALAAIALLIIQHQPESTADSATPSPWFRLPSLEIAGQADLRGALSLKFAPLLLSLLMVDFFDTLGTVTSIGEQSRLVDERNRVTGLRRILFVDAISASIGGWLGVSSVTSYIESAAGVAEGARTGLHSVVVGLLFLLAMFAAPLVALLPPAATASALIVVGFLMAEPLLRINFSQPDTAIPAFVTLLLIPLTYSISHGIGYGVLTFVAIRVLTLRWSDVHPLMYGAAIVFAAAFTLEG
ncbi:MAG: NCS2 family permease [Planctomycetota bacterium]|jgi:AGZA family xanthine/uracil permease-like MFS transporter